MPVDVAQLIARVSSDTSDAEADWKRLETQFGASAEEANRTVGQINKLSETVGFQQRELQLLTQRHAESVQANGLFAEGTQQLQLRIDKLSASVRDNSQALESEVRDLARLADEAEKAGRSMGTLGEIATGALRQIGAIGVEAALGGIQALGAAAADFVATGVETYATNERLSLSFQTMLAAELQAADATLSRADALEQASGKSQELLQWSQQIALNSPLDQQSITDTLRLAQAYGFTSEQAKGLTQTVVDFTSGSGQSAEVMERVITALGQIQTNGKLSGEEMNQLAEAGVNVRQILANAFGVSTAEIGKLSEQGKLLADDVLPAIRAGLDESFGGAAARMGGTIDGLRNSLADLYAQGSADILGPAIREVQPAVQELVTTLQSPEAKAALQELGATIGDVAADVLPQLLDGGREVVAWGRDLGDALDTISPLSDALGRSFGELYGSAQSVWPFVRDVATPTVVGLTGVMEIGLGMVAEFSNAQLQALNVLVGPYRQLQGELDAVTERVLISQPAWQDSSAALEAYGEMSAATREKVAPYVDALQNEQRTIEDLTRSLALRTSAGLLSEEQIAREKNVIGQHLTALQGITDQLQRRQEAEIAASQAATMRSVTEDRLTRNSLAGAEATKLSADELEKYEAKLAKAAESGADAYDRRLESQDAYAAQSTQRATAHSQRLVELETGYHAQITEANTAYTEGQTEAETAYAERVTELQEAAGRKRLEATEREGERREGSEQQLNEKLIAIARQRSEEQGEFDRARVTAERDYYDQVGEVQGQYADKIADAERQLGERLGEIANQRTGVLAEAQADREAAEQDHRGRLLALQEQANDQQQAADQKLADARETAQQQYADTLEAIDQQIADKQQAADDASYERALKLQDRLTDLQSQAAQRQTDLLNSASNGREDRATNYADKIEDLEREMSQSGSLEQQERLQAALAKEQEKFARDEERAARDLARKQERLERELAQQETAAAQQAAREEERAARALAREQEQIAVKRAIHEADLAEQLARLDQQAQRESQQRQQALQNEVRDLLETHTQELAAIETRTNGELEKLNDLTIKAQEQFTQRRTDASTFYADAVTAAQTAYSDELLALDDKHRQEAEKNAQAVADAKAAFDQREQDAAEQYQRLIDKQNEELGRQATEAQSKYNDQLLALQTAQRDQLKAVEDRYTDQAAKEQDAFEAAEQRARESYAKQQDDLNEALAERVIAFTEAELAANKITQAQAAQRIGAVADRYGIDPEARQAQFATFAGAFATDPVGGGASAGGASGGGVLNLGGITINGSLLTENDLGELMIRLLSRTAQLNGGSLQLGALTIGGPQ